MILLTFAFILSTPTLAKKPALKEATGKFLRAEGGDYLHIVIQQKKKEVSFWCYGQGPFDCEQLMIDNKKHAGKNIVIKYQEKDVFIEEAGEKVHQKQALSWSFKE